jgi:hypothetical protein
MLGKLWESTVNAQPHAGEVLCFLWGALTNLSFTALMAISPTARNSSDEDRVAVNIGPVSVGKLMTPITAHLLQKKGTVIASLLANWPTIAGPSIAKATRPQKLSVTRAKAGASSGGSQAAHLHLEVEPSRALEVQYMIPQLIERINQSLGYRAVEGVRIVQVPAGFTVKKPVQVKRAAPPPPAEPRQEPKAPASRLEQALARMAKGMQHRNDELRRPE